MHHPGTRCRVWLQHHAFPIQESRTHRRRQGSCAVSHRPRPHESRWVRQGTQERHSRQSHQGRREGAGGEDGCYLRAESERYVIETSLLFQKFFRLHLWMERRTLFGSATDMSNQISAPSSALPSPPIASSRPHLQRPTCSVARLTLAATRYSPVRLEK